MSMSYTGAGEPAPAGGTTAGYVFYKAMFDHIFAQFNNALTRMNTWLPAGNAANVATPNTVVGALVQRGAVNAEANVGYLAVNPLTATTLTAIQTVLPTGHTGLAWLVSLAGVMTSQMDAFGNLTMGGRIKAGTADAGGGVFITDTTGRLLAGALAGIVPAANGGTGAASPAAHGLLIAQGAAAMTTVAPGTNGNFLISNGTDWVSQVFALPTTFLFPYTQLADYKPSTNAAAATITVAAGGAHFDGAGTFLAGFGQRTVALANGVSATQPTGTNIQNVAISEAPGGGLVATGGTVAAAGTATNPAAPVGNLPVAFVVWRGATTNPSNVVAAADITDARGPGGVGAGGSGGVGLPATAPVITNGDYTATDANSHSIQTAAGLIGGSTAAGSGVLSDMWSIFTRPDIAVRLSSSGATVTLSAGAGVYTGPGGPNFTYGFGGSLRTLTASATATASGAAGQRTLVMDANPANPALTLQAVVTLSTTQFPVAYYYWDGTVLYDNGNTAFKTMANGVHSPQVAVDKITSTQTTDQASASYTAYTGAANMPDAGFANGATCNVRVTLRVRASITTTAAGGSLECLAYLDGAAVQETDCGQGVPNAVTSPSSLEVWLTATGWLSNLAAGNHTFGLRYSTVNCTVVLHTRTITVELFG